MTHRSIGNNSQSIGDSTSNKGSVRGRLVLLRPENHLEASCRLGQRYQKIASQLERINNFHHQPNQCLCSSCDCGRHFCKLHIVKPDLTKRTVYQNQFSPKKPIENLVLRGLENSNSRGPHLDLASTYLKDFHPVDVSPVTRHKPDDQLKSEGPVGSITSYRSFYPGHKGQNQHVPMTDQNLLGPIPFRSKSTYCENYSQKSPAKNDYEYFPDQLRTGKSWMGNSTYGSFFKPPQTKDYAKTVKFVQKLDINPEDHLQYKTMYRQQFTKVDSRRCPAIEKLTQKYEGISDSFKTRLADNTNFKALSFSSQGITKKDARHH